MLRILIAGQTIVTHVMNPKSMPRSRLLGEMDHDTREWTDGVLTSAARQVVKEPSNVRSWIVCDGDVDPEWIEVSGSSSELRCASRFVFVPRRHGDGCIAQSIILPCSRSTPCWMTTTC